MHGILRGGFTVEEWAAPVEKNQPKRAPPGKGTGQVDQGFGNVT